MSSDEEPPREKVSIKKEEFSFRPEIAISKIVPKVNVSERYEGERTWQMTDEFPLLFPLPSLQSSSSGLSTSQPDLVDVIRKKRILGH